MVKIKGVPIEPLVQILREKPYRLTHLRAVEDEEQPVGYQLCVGPECQAPVEDPAEIARLLHGEG